MPRFALGRIPQCRCAARGDEEERELMILPLSDWRDFGVYDMMFRHPTSDTNKTEWKTTMKQLHVFGMMFSAVLVAAASAHAQETPASAEGNDPLNAVVKLEVTTAKPDICCPWANRTDAATGSGAVIAPGRILTCAHCVTDACYIRVRKHNEDMLYHGSVEFVDNDADLALVRVDETAFMEGITPMEIGETPHVQDDVLAVGYPRGGEDISYTRGIVSRIEDIRYSHGWTYLLGIQVGAAINPGNSGGPVLDMKSGKIAGIAFQGLGKEEGESLGYIIPPDIIRHFLKDIQDGKVDGFPDFLFSEGQMESPAKRRYYRMDSGRTGVIVEDVDSVLGKDSIRTNDIILEVDGYKVSNNGRIRLKGSEPRSLYYPIYMRQIGERIPVNAMARSSKPSSLRRRRICASADGCMMPNLITSSMAVLCSLWFPSITLFNPKRNFTISSIGTRTLSMMRPSRYPLALPMRGLRVILVAKNRLCGV